MDMNGGLHEAVNLAGKLIAIVQNSAGYVDPFALFDCQRRHIAIQFVQDHTIKTKSLWNQLIQTFRQSDKSGL